jgi:hypothetical protein
MLSKEVFETLSNQQRDGYYYLPPSCIKAAIKLKPVPQHHNNLIKERKLIENEILKDTEALERAKLVCKKLRILSGNNVLALLPVTVPEMPSAYMPRSDVIENIKLSLLIMDDQDTAKLNLTIRSGIKDSEDKSTTCVLQGMGGMGKTIVATSFVHDVEVYKHN